MSIDKQIKEVELIAKKLETEKNFDVMVADFSNAATLIKSVLSDLTDVTGTITEIIDGVEQSFKIHSDENS